MVCILSILSSGMGNSMLMVLYPLVNHKNNTLPLITFLSLRSFLLTLIGFGKVQIASCTPISWKGTTLVAHFYVVKCNSVPVFLPCGFCLLIEIKTISIIMFSLLQDHASIYYYALFKCSLA